MTTAIKMNTVSMTGVSFKEFYEFCYKASESEQGINTTFSLCLIANEMLMRETYTKLTERLYSESNIPKMMEFHNKNSELILKYADRNNNGDIVYEENGAPKISEMIVEYNSAYEVISKEYEDVLNDRRLGIIKNDEIFAEPITTKIFNVAMEYIPENLSPRLVSYFASDVLINLLDE